MWGHKTPPDDGGAAAAPARRVWPGKLRDALREARQEAADRKDVVVDLRDAELVRLELLNEALDPVFADVPPQVDLFDRAIGRGDTPRLWIDLAAHVAMGRDKRQYRFLRDTRLGRSVILESYEIPEMVDAITRYVARRLVERDQALAGGNAPVAPAVPTRAASTARGLLIFVVGFLAGGAALVAAAFLFARHG